MPADLTPEKARRDECTCPGGPNDPYEGDTVACIAGTVYTPCENANCGGVCDPISACNCPLHENATHDNGYGGTYHD